MRLSTVGVESTCVGERHNSFLSYQRYHNSHKQCVSGSVEEKHCLKYHSPHHQSAIISNPVSVANFSYTSLCDFTLWCMSLVPWETEWSVGLKYTLWNNFMMSSVLLGVYTISQRAFLLCVTTALKTSCCSCGCSSGYLLCYSCQMGRTQRNHPRCTHWTWPGC